MPSRYDLSYRKKVHGRTFLDLFRKTNSGRDIACSSDAPMKSCKALSFGPGYDHLDMCPAFSSNLASSLEVQCHDVYCSLHQRRENHG